jgi:chaperonin GroES
MKVNDNFIVVKKQLEEKTESGIYIPKEAEVHVDRALVIAVADDLKEFVSPDDVVVFNKQRGVPVEIEGTEHLVLQKQDILFIP